MSSTYFVTRCFLAIVCISSSFIHAEPVKAGVDVFFEKKLHQSLKGKRVALITNHTAVDGKMIPTWRRFVGVEGEFSLVALFAPEHGFYGQEWASEKISDVEAKGLPVYSLHGETRRPSREMLKDIDVLVYDIQEIGVRSYTYCATLFYAMEEAAKRGIQVIVLDRPNPINGLTIDGPLLESEWRSFIGYVNVPYCHGMTIGELAQFFNGEYKIGCELSVVPMRGWKRWMTYRDTELLWIPPSPNIPEADTPFFYSSTGGIGALSLLNIGIGHTLPFKIAGAPWIDAEKFAEALNRQNLKGVYFVPFYFKPFCGLYKNQNCQGVLIRITDPLQYRPFSVQSLLLGILKTLYPKQVRERISSGNHLVSFNKANGTEAILRILQQEKYATWKLLTFDELERRAFSLKRQKYLIPIYSSE